MCIDGNGEDIATCMISKFRKPHVCNAMVVAEEVAKAYLAGLQKLCREAKSHL